MKIYLTRTDVARLADVTAPQVAHWELKRYIVPVAQTKSGRFLYDEAQVGEWLKKWRPQHEARQPKKREGRRRRSSC